MHSSFETENITYGSPLGKCDHLVFEMDYTIKEEVLRDKKVDLDRKKYKEGN